LYFRPRRNPEIRGSTNIFLEVTTRLDLIMKEMLISEKEIILGVWKGTAFHG
jgi:hypothetical protein